MLRLPLLVGVLAAVSLMVAASPATSAPVGVTASPQLLQFPDTFDLYPEGASVTLTNNTNKTVTLTATSASPSPPFLVETLGVSRGGTCHVTYAYAIPPHASCTVDFGFEPLAARAYGGVGTLTFDTGEILYVGLEGRDFTPIP